MDFFSIFTSQIMGLSVISLFSLALVTILSVLYLKWRGRKGREDIFINMLVLKLIDYVAELSAEDEEVIRLLNLIREQYIGGPNETDNEIVEAIDQKKQQVYG